MIDEGIQEAIRLMNEFASRTGLTGSTPPRRYLWTDAHGVCNYLTLASLTGEHAYIELATRLVHQVHSVLGRHRRGDVRTGWISGLDEDAGEAHPTCGGLRIGKLQPERRVDQRYDPEAEWDRDGQYYHYLTKWMHALLNVGRVTGESRYLAWAAELAVAALRGFRTPGPSSGIWWKMSIDLGRPLVAATGQHDPLDGLITALAIHGVVPAEIAAILEGTISDLSGLCTGSRWETDDPLGIGGLLFDASRLAQLLHAKTDIGVLPGGLLEDLLTAADKGINAFLRTSSLRRPADERLAFRELGLGIGLHAVPLLYEYGLPAAGMLMLDRLQARSGLASEIESFWLKPAQQRTATWLAHEDINAVMLATSLAPDNFLRIRS